MLVRSDGVYAINEVELPSGTYVADIRQGAHSVNGTGQIVVGKTQAESVEIVISAGGGKISGTIQGPVAKFRNASVSLLPQGTARENLSLIKTVSTSSGNSFSIADIPPGTYKLFAWENLAAGAAMNAQFMSNYEGRGRSITVAANSVFSNITLPLIEN